MRIAYYFEPFRTRVVENDDLRILIDLHERTFRNHGWEPVRLNERTARRHPLYEFFSRRDTILAKSRNEWTYTRACYMRWLAYAVEGIPFCDLDVLNYGFTPRDAEELLAEAKLPLLISKAGAAGLLKASDFESVIRLFVQFAEKPVVRGLLATEDINDMTILQEYRPEWFTQVPFTDPRYAKDYTTEGWRHAKLVHYPYHYTPKPRGRSAMRARPTEEMAWALAFGKELTRLECGSVLDLACDSGQLASVLVATGYAGKILSLASPAESRRSISNMLDNTASWMMLPQLAPWELKSHAPSSPAEAIAHLAGQGLAESVRAGFDAMVVQSSSMVLPNFQGLLDAFPSLKLVALREERRSEADAASAALIGPQRVVRFEC